MNHPIPESERRALAREHARRVAQPTHPSGLPIITIPADASDPTAVRDTYEETVATYERIKQHAAALLGEAEYLATNVADAARRGTANTLPNTVLRELEQRLSGLQAWMDNAAGTPTPSLKRITCPACSSPDMTLDRTSITAPFHCTACGESFSSDDFD